MASGLQIKTKGKWKDVSLEGTDLSTFDDDAFSGLISMQELTDYEIVGSKTEKKKKAVDKKSEESSNKSTVLKDKSNESAGKQKKRKAVVESDVNKAERNGKAVVKTDANQGSGTKNQKKRSAEESTNEPKKKKRKKKAKKKQIEDVDDEISDVEEEPESAVKEFTENDLPGWKGMFVPGPVLRALYELGFTAPTPIQALTLPSAIRDRKDIVGAAETGSGKTLSFGIPLIHHILERKAALNPDLSELFQSESSDELSDLEMEDVSENPDFDGGSITSTDTSDNEEFPPKVDSDDQDQEDVEGYDELGGSDEDDGEEEDEQEEEEEEDDKVEKVAVQNPLYALILTPTRELAIQVRNHIQNVAKYTDIKVTTVVGGISLDKQRRLLRRRPEIVVATPGRLWELMQEGNPHLAQVPQIPFLVIDECDRMVEKGHFQELSSILELMNNDENSKNKRQTFVFSATLTFVHDAPARFKKKKKLKKLTSDDKLESLMGQIGVKAKPKVVDLTKKTGTAETLTETKIHCSTADKDVYLYYFLQHFPGRTLVFTNSKDCLRRLLSILTLLQCNPLPLHADMHQKQRLKNLERFTSSPNGLLLATDVAARGLDIPDVQHVIHFQVPQTTENYIHRSGRTARASKEGLSFVIIGPDDVKNYRKILRALKRTEDIPQLPVEMKYLTGIKERINLAKSIDVQEHKKAKIHHHNKWFLKAAKEMDIELEDDLLHDTGDSEENSQYKARIQSMRNQLKSLLRTPIVSDRGSHRYPTMSGKLVVPFMAPGQAIDRVKNSKPLKMKTSLPLKPVAKSKKKNARKQKRSQKN